MQLYQLLSVDQSSPGWVARIANNLSKPYQYAFGGTTETAWHDFREGRIVSGLVKTAAVIALLVPSYWLSAF